MISIPTNFPKQIKSFITYLLIKMTNRLPEDYKLKESTGWNYFKITEESQSFRILTSPIIWWEYFREESDWKVKPVRQKE